MASSRTARAAGMLRNVRELHRRVGMGGVAELLVSRAFPRALSYTRMLAVEMAVGQGVHHPQLEAVRLRAPDPRATELLAALSGSGEPEVPAFSAEDLASRFEAGYELWLFHLEGQVACAIWSGPPRLLFGDLSVPIEQGDRVAEAAVTIPALRNRGMHRMGVEHMHAVARDEGVKRMLSAVNGFNRVLLAKADSHPGVTVLARLRMVSVAGRRWVRVSPETDSGRRLFERAGLPANRWARSPADNSWNQAASSPGARNYLDPRMAAAKRRAHLDLLGRWLPDLASATVLKTDLWEEGMGGDELLFELARRSGHAYGVDVAQSVVERAQGLDRRNGNTSLIQADVRHLPLEDGSVDAVVSTSTLDHLPQLARSAALEEMRRVMRPGGVLVITGDNASNVGDPLLRAAARLGLVPFPLDDSVSLTDLERLATDAGFECDRAAYLVHGPRLITTASVRMLRRLGGSDRAVDRLLGGYAAAGRRAPRQMAAFVALRATAR